MPDVRKHMYMESYPVVCTQAGTRQMTRKEEKEAIAEITENKVYLIDVVKTPTQPVWVVIASGIAIIASIVVGVAAYLLFIF